MCFANQVDSFWGIRFAQKQAKMLHQCKYCVPGYTNSNTYSDRAVLPVLLHILSPSTEPLWGCFQPSFPLVLVISYWMFLKLENHLKPRLNTLQFQAWCLLNHLVLSSHRESKYRVEMGNQWKCPLKSWCVGVSTLSLSRSKFSWPFKEKCISDVVRIDSIIISHLSQLWKTKFFILYDVIFLVRLLGNLMTLWSERVNSCILPLAFSPEDVPVVHLLRGPRHLTPLGPLDGRSQESEPPGLVPVVPAGY